MKKPIDWDRYAPLGLAGRRVRQWLCWLLTIGGVGSLQFLSRYAAARNQLYRYTGRKAVLIPNSKIEGFRTLLGGSFLPMAAVLPAILGIAVYLYLYHCQGSRSIYTMRRLPSRRELVRRCLALPGGALLAAAVLTAVLTGVYYLIWRFCTPAVCLP